MSYCTVFALFVLYLSAISKCKPLGAYIRRGEYKDGIISGILPNFGRV